nr:MAG TPA: hypothetical protein [Caudoviricetes sp.]
MRIIPFSLHNKDTNSFDNIQHIKHWYTAS